LALNGLFVFLRTLDYAIQDRSKLVQADEFDDAWILPLISWAITAIGLDQWIGTIQFLLWGISISNAAYFINRSRKYRILEVDPLVISSCPLNQRIHLLAFW
jgi:hypothetical protein